MVCVRRPRSTCKTEPERYDVMTQNGWGAGMTRFSRCAWPVVLVLTLVSTPSAAFAKSVACYPVKRGDTASRLAKRITGDASNKYQPWFDIVDLAGRSVPKSQYDRVRSGWRACVPGKTVEHRSLKEGQGDTRE